MKNNLLYIFIILISYISISNGLPHLVLMGPPGAGKGTFAQMLATQYNYVHICPGALLRAEAKANSPLGISIKSAVESGKALPPIVTWAVVQNHIQEALKRGCLFIIDGFPKNQECFDYLISFLEKEEIRSLVRFIYFYALENNCLERITSRLECHYCGATFNLISKKPIEDGICDLCKKPLCQRKGDDLKTAQYRLTDYNQNIAPVIGNILKLYPVLTIDTSTLSLVDAENAYKRVISNLENDT